MTSVILGLYMAVCRAVRASQQVTFSETVAPILYQNCVTCHRPG